jgi:hypothetical protein
MNETKKEARNAKNETKERNKKKTKQENGYGDAIATQKMKQNEARNAKDEKSCARNETKKTRKGRNKL